MSAPVSLARHGFHSSLAAASTALVFLLLVAAGRILGAQDFGRFAFALSFVVLFDFLFDPGLYHLLIREIARSRAQAARLLAHALTWKLLVTPPALLALVLALVLLGVPREGFQAVALIAVSHVFASLSQGLRAGLLGAERFDLDALCVIAERAALLGFGLAALLAGGGLVALCWTFVGVRLAGLVLCFALVHARVARLALGFDLGYVRELIVAAAPIGGFYIALNVYNHVDTVMLASLRSETEVGWYGAAYRLYEGLLVVPGILSSVFLPRLSRTWHERDHSFGDLLERALRYALALGFAAALNAWLLARVLLLVPFGPEFEGAIGAFRLLSLALPAVFGVQLLYTAWIGMDRQRRVLVFAVGGLLANVALNALAIPRFGVIGAAFSTAAVELSLIVLLLASFARSGVALNRHRGLSAPLLAAAAAATSVALLGGLPLPLLLIAANVVFLGVAWLAGFVGEEERRWLRSLRGR